MLLKERFIIQCVNGENNYLGFGLLLLLIHGELLEILPIIISLSLKFLTNRLDYQDGLLKELGMILICLKLAMEA